MEQIPCDPDRECKYRDTTGCYQDVDHKYSPKFKYRGKIERAFRELVIHKTISCRQVHDDRHATEPHPKKPSRAEMLGVLNANQ